MMTFHLGYVRALLKQVHQCDACHYHFCGTPVNVIEFRVVTDDESVPTVLRMCGVEGVSQGWRQVSKMMLKGDHEGCSGVNR